MKCEDTIVAPTKTDFSVEEIESLHLWIEQICDPDAVLELSEIFERIVRCVSKKESSYQDSSVKDKQERSRQFVLNLSPDKIKPEVTSRCARGQNEPFRIRGADDFLFEGSFSSDGYPHGFFRKINEDGDVEFFGCFVHGILHGTCWKTTLGGGFLLSSSIEFSDDEMAFLYPDGQTALVGSFDHERMLSAVATEVVGTSRGCTISGNEDDEESLLDALPVSSTCPCYQILMKPRFRKIDAKVPTFHFDPSTETKISSDPRLPDPYEGHFVRIGASRLPHAGQGLFAADNIEPATVVAFYNGIKINESEYFENNNNGDKDINPDDELADWTCYRLNLTDDIVIDIPREMAAPENYCASLGHKICHSFRPNCAFEDFYHPRFGQIKCIVSLTNIRKGEELTAHYEYKLADAPAWYKKLWARHQKQIRKMPDWNTALRCRTAKVILPISTGNGSSSSGSCRSRTSSTGSSRTISESRTPDTIPEEDLDSE